MNSIFYCETCNKDISKSNKAKHIKSTKHINNVNNGYDEIKYHYHCRVCNEEIIRSNKARHEKTRKHIINSSSSSSISLNPISLNQTSLHSSMELNQSGGDLQSLVTKLPGFPWAKYKGEFHLP